MPYIRQDINGNSPLDMKNMNDNFRFLWLKVMGDINMSDIQDDIKSMLYTNWLPFQGEGNLDSTHELYIRFFVPPTTKTIKSANLNVLVSRYRMDSGVANSSPSNSYGSATTSGASNVNSSGGSGAFNISQTSSVRDWKAGDGTGWKTPTAKIPGDFGTIVANGTMLWVNAHKVDNSSPDAGYFIDLYDMNHRHDFSVSAGDHSHNIQHTHSIDVSITVPAHSHNLNEGIKESSVVPSHVRCYINDTDLGVDLGENGVQNNIDVKDNMLIGQWNIIKITTTSLARVTIYGIAELLQNYK